MPTGRATQLVLESAEQAYVMLHLGNLTIKANTPKAATFTTTTGQREAETEETRLPTGD
jgi:hypothetical protein